MKFKIPGLTFSWRRALGITKLKQRIARATGIPTTKQGRYAKIGRTITKGIGIAALAFLGKKIINKGPKTPKPGRAEYRALKNVSMGKPADLSDLTNQDYVTRPTYSTDMTSYTEYIPRLTPLGEEALRNYENK